jgi:DUF971 family protein
LVRGLGVDLHTVVLNWEEFSDLQLAFLKASVPDAEIPTDHVIAAALYATARDHDIGTIISGTSAVTEGIMPSSWTYGIMDWRYIHSVHRRYGKRSISTLPHLTLGGRFLNEVILRIQTIPLLNWCAYRKSAAIDELQKKVGWRPYEGKHHESIYTRFFQSFILPRKFGIDKRKAHLSSLVCAGELTRADALAELARDICPPEVVESDRQFVMKKLGLGEVEFERMMKESPRSHRDFPSTDGLIRSVEGVVVRARSLGLLPRSWI